MNGSKIEDADDEICKQKCLDFLKKRVLVLVFGSCSFEFHQSIKF